MVYWLFLVRRVGNMLMYWYVLGNTLMYWYVLG